MAQRMASVCVLPPTRTWPMLQRQRCFNDRGFVRWPPHIRLLEKQILLNDELLQPFSATIADAVSCQLKPFEVGTAHGTLLTHSQVAGVVSTEHEQVEAPLQRARCFVTRNASLARAPGQHVLTDHTILCRVCPALQVTLRGFKHFEHPNSYTLWLDVESPGGCARRVD